MNFERKDELDFILRHFPLGAGESYHMGVKTYDYNLGFLNHDETVTAGLVFSTRKFSNISISLITLNSMEFHSQMTLPAILYHQTCKSVQVLEETF